ncbi:MAG: DUF1289 domain-containing protein [Sedimenticola sp.]|uniref:DUF1289 domain-containing protein n=1 Tax=Sedimenticola thiotaurini TaxID=1543721 RepID=A0A558CG04_9GAMM|nr:DUF1289 domain-containing protein [Sedimenticola sp.]TVT47709.1 MAG: DUF1289 domain-containing protein [Sedimenticola thiotaurini]MCW8880726.1 DUF1289 domain-containing protein [Sedimenticola sp.]MCW8921492.1 DUF1289 domain-containing protein [Sedimenticola sp.]MCW8950072.1 DUF1289 domain-containing protein [Sedimenticola sp.]
MNLEEAIASPCVRMCTLDDDDICIGCGRSLEEIKQWTSYSPRVRVAKLIICRQRRDQRKIKFHFC